MVLRALVPGTDHMFCGRRTSLLRSNLYEERIDYHGIPAKAGEKYIGTTMLFVEPVSAVALSQDSLRAWARSQYEAGVTGGVADAMPVPVAEPEPDPTPDRVAAPWQVARTEEATRSVTRMDAYMYRTEMMRIIYETGEVGARIEALGRLLDTLIDSFDSCIVISPISKEALRISRIERALLCAESEQNTSLYYSARNAFEQIEAAIAATSDDLGAPVCIPSVVPLLAEVHVGANVGIVIELLRVALDRRIAIPEGTRIKASTPHSREWGREGEF